MAEFNQSEYIQQYMKDNVVVKKVTFSRKRPEDMRMLRWMEDNKVNFSGLVKNMIREEMEKPT